MTEIPKGFKVVSQPAAIPKGFRVVSRQAQQPSVAPGAPQQSAARAEEILSPSAREKLTPEQQARLMEALEKQLAISGTKLQPTQSTRIANLEQKFRASAPKGAELASDLPEIGEAPELQFAPTLNNFKQSIATSLITNDVELGNALQKSIPGSELIQDPAGRPLLKMPNGKSYAINKPNISPQDINQTIARIFAFLPAGRGVAGAGKAALGKVASRSAAIETGLQGVEAGVGGEFSPGEIALAGVAAPVGQVVGEKVLTPIAKGVVGAIPEGAKEVIKEGVERGVKVLTSDVLPPKTNITKTLQQLSEKLGILGSAGIRAEQQEAREAILNKLGNDFNLSVESEGVLTKIVDSLNTGVAKAMEKGAQQKGEAAFRLAPFGEVPIPEVKREIARQLGSLAELKATADKTVIETLENYSDSLSGANFRVMDKIRSNLIDDIRAARAGDPLPTKAEAPLQAVKAALDKAMIKFGRGIDNEATDMWLKGNKNFFELYGKAKNSILKRAIRDGDMKPETLGKIIKAGETSDLRRLNSLLDEKGRESARFAIIREALEKSGFFAGGANPDRFINEIQRGPSQRAINVFFKGSDRKMIDGIVRILDATRRAQQAAAAPATGQQVVSGSILVGGGAGLATNPIATILTGGSLAAMARGFESRAARDFLLKMSSVPKGSPKEAELLEKILPATIAISQGLRPEEN